MKKVTLTLIGIILGLSIATAQGLNNSSPIEEFYIENENGVSTLVWTTEKETNTSYFIIEQSENNNDYKIVSKVEAKGYSLTEQNYSYEMFDKLTTNTNIRITLVNMNGERLISQSLNVLNDSNENLNQMAAE